MRFQLLKVLLLSIFCLVVQNSYAVSTDPSATYNINEARNIYEDESIVNLTIPFDQSVKDQIIAQLTAPGTQIKEVRKLEIDPVNRLLSLEGTAVLPAYVLSDMDYIAGGEDTLPVEHRFNISFKLPTAKKLALTRYFQIQIVEFKLGGHSYLKAFNRISQFCVGMLLNTSFMNYMLDVKPEMQLSEDNIALQIKQLIEKKGLRFRGNTIAFKLDSAMIPNLATYAAWLDDFRLWQFSPVVFKGTKEVIALKVQAGSGKPSKEWLDNVASRYESDKRSLTELREELYTKYSNISDFEIEAKEFIDGMKLQLMLENLTTREENEITKIGRTIVSRARDNLNRKNPLFLSDPEDTYENTKRDMREYAVSGLTNLKRKYILDRKILAGGGSVRGVPFIQKRVSQDTFSQAGRFFRDFDFEGEQMLKEIQVIFNPTLPGVTVRGLLNVNVSTFMEMGLEGSGIVWPKKPWRVAEDVWGSGMPFETSLRVKMLDNGWLGFDLETFSILSGSERTPIDTKSEHGAALNKWVKMALVNSMATTWIEDPTATTAPTDIEELEKREKKLRDRMLNQGGEFKEVINSRSDLESLVDLARIDIEQNPFIMAGRDHVQGKMDMFFKELIKYDEESGLIIFKMDSRIVAEQILNTQNNVQVWNVESLYDKKLNQTFLEMTAGNRTRSKDYVNFLNKRAENEDSQNFVGIDESRETAPVDMRLKIDLASFERFANEILSDAYNVQNKQTQKELAKDNEFEHYLMKDMGLKVVGDGILKMNLTLTHVKKAKRSVINPRRWFGESYKVTNKTINLSTEIALSVEKLSMYKKGLKVAKNEVFHGEELLRLDIRHASFTTRGDTSVLDKIVNLVASDVDFKNSFIDRKVKFVLLKFMNKFLHSTDDKKNGNVRLGGVRLNQFMKLLTHKEDILIQINPRVATAAFDMRLVPNQKFNEQNLGLTLNKKNSTLGLDFQTSGAMASVDKGELVRIMIDTSELISPLLELNDKDEFIRAMNVAGIYDKLFYNSDYTKRSMVHRLKHVMTNYSSIIDIIEPDVSVLDAINRAMNTRLAFVDTRSTSSSPSLSGVEIMYFASTAMVIRNSVNALMDHAKELGIQESRQLDQFYVQAEELKDRFLIPLMNRYERDFSEHNVNIIKKGPTDWNFSYYPEASYSESVLKQLKRLPDNQ
jgi:hypothetical protein